MHKGYQHLTFNKAIVLKEMIKQFQKIILFYLSNHNLKKSPFLGPYHKTVDTCLYFEFHLNRDLKHVFVNFSA